MHTQEFTQTHSWYSVFITQQQIFGVVEEEITSHLVCSEPLELFHLYISCSFITLSPQILPMGSVELIFHCT